MCHPVGLQLCENSFLEDFCYDPSWAQDVRVQWERPDQFLQDYERTLSELPNLFDNYTVPYERWNHVDFLWAKDIDTLLHPRDQLYKNRSSGKTDSQQEKWSSGRPILLKLVSESQFSVKTYFIQLPPGYCKTWRPGSSSSHEFCEKRHQNHLLKTCIVIYFQFRAQLQL